MTERTEALTQVSAPVHPLTGSYLDWPAVLAGAVVAAAIGFVFSTFGAAIGLSLVSPYDGDGSALAAAVAVAIWMVWTAASSFIAGGYIAGRMRRRVDTAEADEVAVRDGIHGLTVWGAGVVIGVVLLGGTFGTVTGALGDAASAAASAAGSQAADAAAETASEAARQMSEADIEQARIYGVLSAFVTAAALLVAGAAAYWAASLGGRHRDEGASFAHFGHWK